MKGEWVMCGNEGWGVFENPPGLPGIYAGMTGWLANQKPITATTKRFSYAGWICRP